MVFPSPIILFTKSPLVDSDLVKSPRCKSLNSEVSGIEPGNLYFHKSTGDAHYLRTLGFCVIV